MTKLYADFISQQQSILRGAGLVEAKNPQEVSVNYDAKMEAGRREHVESQPATKIVWEPNGRGGHTTSTQIEPQPSTYKARYLGYHDGPKGSGKIYAVTTHHPETGQKKVKYFAGNYNPANKYRPGGGGAQGKHTDLHDTPEEAANQFHGK